MSRNERCRLRGGPCRRPRTLSGRSGIRTGYSCIRTVTGAIRRPGRPRSTAPGNVGFRSLRSRNCRRSPVVRHTGRRGRSGGNPRIRGGQGARNFGGRTGFRNIGRIDAQEFGTAETRRNHDRRDADPQRPVQPAGRLDPHGLVSLRVQQPVERGCKRKILEFEHADALYGQHVALARAGKPAVVNILCSGSVAVQRTRQFIGKRYPLLLRREGYHAAGRKDCTFGKPPGTAPLDKERPYARQEHPAAGGKQVADKAVHFIDHRVIAHRFFFFGVAAGAFGTGAGETSGPDTPR